MVNVGNQVKTGHLDGSHGNEHPSNMADVVKWIQVDQFVHLSVPSDSVCTRG